MDSMYQSVFRKTAFTLNAHERNALLLSQKRTVNGNFIKKIRTFSGIGDFFLLTDTTPGTSSFSKSSPQKLRNSLGLHKLESFYAKKSPIFQNLSFLFSYFFSIPHQIIASCFSFRARTGSDILCVNRTAVRADRSECVKKRSEAKRNEANCVLRLRFASSIQQWGVAKW